MSTVTKSVDVAVPVSTAYNQWTQFESFPEFMDGVDSVQQIDETHCHWVVKAGAAVTREFDTEITEQTPDQLIAWKSTGGDSGSHSGRVTFTSVDDGTRVDIELGWEPEGLVEKAGELLGVDQRTVDKSADQFKVFIELRGEETGAWRGDVDSAESASADPAGDTAQN